MKLFFLAPSVATMSCLNVVVEFEVSDVKNHLPGFSVKDVEII